MRPWIVVIGAMSCYRPVADSPSRGDGGVDGAVADAAFACPPNGGVPSFGAMPFPAVYSSCFDYTVSEAAELVVAVCGNGGNEVVSAGGLVGELSPVPAFSDAAHSYDLTRLSPAGDELFVRVETLGTASYTFERFTRNGSDWSFAGPVSLAGITVMGMSAPTAGGLGRTMMVLDNTNLTYELVESTADDWTIRNTYAPSDLGLASQPLSPVLTDDGLHFLFGPSSYLVGSDWTYFASRADPSGAFGSAQPLLTAPMGISTYLETGCGRFYYTQATMLDYVEQR